MSRQHGPAALRPMTSPVRLTDVPGLPTFAAAHQMPSPVHPVDMPRHPRLNASYQMHSPVHTVDTPGHPSLNTTHSLPPVRFTDVPHRSIPVAHQIPPPIHVANSRPSPTAANQIPSVHAVNTYGPITDRTFPPVHTVDISDRSQLPYPIHRPHHTRPLSPQALNIPPPVAGRSFDPPPTGTTQPKQPDNPTQRSNVAAPSPQPQEVDVIEIDEDEEDNGSNPSDGENDDGPDNAIDLLAVSEFSSESGVKVMFPQQIRSRSNPAISVLLKC